MEKIKRFSKPVLTATLLIAVVFSVAAIVRVTLAEPVDTYHSSWHLVRETADEDGSSFAAVYDLSGVGTDDGDFASKDSSSVASGGPFHIRSYNTDDGPHEGFSAGGAWMFVICGENFNNTDDTFSFNIVGWSKTNGMMQVIAEGDGVLGTQAVGIYPDGGDALGRTVSETGVEYTHSTTTLTTTGDGFDGAVVGMLARVTGTNLTNEIVQITTVTNANVIICSGITSTDDNEDSTVQFNPAFWADTINLDETTKWPSVAVYNSGDNEVAFLIVDTTGLEWIQFVLYACDGETNEEAGNLTVYGRRY